MFLRLSELPDEKENEHVHVSTKRVLEEKAVPHVILCFGTSYSYRPCELLEGRKTQIIAFRSEPPASIVGVIIRVVSCVEFSGAASCAGF